MFDSQLSQYSDLWPVHAEFDDSLCVGARQNICQQKALCSLHDGQEDGCGHTLLTSWRCAGHQLQHNTMTASLASTHLAMQTASTHTHTEKQINKNTLKTIKTWEQQKNSPSEANYPCSAPWYMSVLLSIYIQDSRLFYYLIREIKTWLNINHITVHNITYCIF